MTGRPVSYIAPGEPTSPRWAEAFATGCGGRMVEGPNLQAGPVAMFGSPQLWSMFEQIKSEGRDYYYGDHAYFSRFMYFRVTCNALQHDGRGEAGPARFERHKLEIAPWRRSGSHVLVCPPDQPFADLVRFDATLWRENITAELARHTDRPLKIREREGHSEPLSEALTDCWAMVTYASNAAVEAVLAGIPVFCTAPCAARTMGLDDLTRIEAPYMPDGREQWAWNLAANQWTLDEMARGACWEALGR